MGEERAPLVVVALEAAEPALVERWCGEGRLPALASLRERGAWRGLRSPTDVSSGSSWPSLFSGVHPSRHGVGFYHRQLRSGSYEIAKRYADEVAAEPFWLRAAAAGRRVAIFDVPETRPRPRGGTVIAGWGGEALSWPPASSPPGLLGELQARHGRHPLAHWYQRVPRSEAGWRELLEKISTGARRRTRIALDLLGRGRWDLFFGVYAETHWAGHYFWHLIDPAHPLHDPQLAAGFGDAMLQVYQEVDRGIARIAEACPGATMAVLSNTGMGPNYSGRHLVPDVLERLGLGAPPRERDLPGALADRLLPARRWGGARAVERIEQLVSPEWIERVRSLVPERLWDRWTRRFLTAGSRWSESRAFAVPSDYPGGIRINLRGREPQGRVEPGAEYEALCGEIREAFLELENPATGRRAVSDVFRPRDLWTGERLDDLPDLLVRWTGDAAIEALRSARVGTVRGTLFDKRTGAHRPWGFLLAAGEGIRAGEREEADVVDVAPTLLARLGCEPPPGGDGRVLADLAEGGAALRRVG